jgi:hypothetical protein
LKICLAGGLFVKDCVWPLGVKKFELPVHKAFCLEPVLQRVQVARPLCEGIELILTSLTDFRVTEDCLDLLIILNCIDVNHGGRLTAMGFVRALVIVEGHPAPDACGRLKSGFPSMQLHTFILQGSPKTFDQDVVEVGTFAVH